jgi:peptidylprolyl isomerase
MAESVKVGKRFKGFSRYLLIILVISATVPISADTTFITDAAAFSQENQQSVTKEAEKEELPEELPNPRLVIRLDKGGEIIMELLPEEAPLAVERILMLVKEKYYNGMRFHRVESWLIQTGKGFQDYPPVEGEMFFQDLKHCKGSVGMARLVDDYDSATTQFYIIKEPKSVLNGEYTIFAKVVEGMDHVMKVKKGDKIDKIELLE